MAQTAPKYHVITARQARSLDSSRYVFPPAEVLAKLHAGHVIKIVVDTLGFDKAEELWITITLRSNQKFIGMVNDPVHRTRYHGLKRGDPIKFTLSNIVDVCFQGPEVKQEMKII